MFRRVEPRGASRPSSPFQFFTLDIFISYFALYILHKTQLKWPLLQIDYDHVKKIIIISFTLYPAHGSVGRGNLVLRHSVPHFLPNSGGIACWVAELNAALNFDTRAKKWKYKFK